MYTLTSEIIFVTLSPSPGSTTISVKGEGGRGGKEERKEEEGWT